MATTIILAAILLIFFGVYVKEERSLKKNPCNPLDCKSYALGYCEYDFATGQIMPMDPKTCPLIKQNKGDANDKPKNPASQWRSPRY